MFSASVVAISTCGSSLFSAAEGKAKAEDGAVDREAEAEGAGEEAEAEAEDAEEEAAAEEEEEGAVALPVPPGRMCANASCVWAAEGLPVRCGVWTVFEGALAGVCNV